MSRKTLAMKLFAVLGSATLVFLVGCGGNTSQPPAPTAVTVTPSSVTVQTGGVQQFTATVSPSGANQAVTPEQAAREQAAERSTQPENTPRPRRHPLPQP